MTRSLHLFNRNFVLLWLGQAVSAFGSQFYAIAMLFWLKEAYSSATLMGSIVLVSSLPAVVLGPIGGTIADMFSRRTIIILSDVIRGVSVFTLATMLWIMPDAHGLLLVWVFLVGLLNASVAAIFQPAISAAIADYVPSEKLLKANSLRQVGDQTAGLAGQGLGGLAYSLFGAVPIFLFNSLSFLASGFGELFIQAPGNPTERKRATLAEKLRFFYLETIDGFRFVRKSPGMLAFLVGVSAVNFLLAPLSVLLPFYVDDFLALDASWFGYIYGTVTVGSLAGLWVFNRISSRATARRVVLVAMMPMIGLTFALLGVFVVPGISLILFFMVGLFSGIINVNVTTMLQLTTPAHLRGRVFALVATLGRGLKPISAGLTGIIADNLGRDIPLIYKMYGVTLLAIALSLVLFRDFRGFLLRSYTSDTSTGPGSNAV